MLDEPPYFGKPFGTLERRRPGSGAVAAARRVTSVAYRPLRRPADERGDDEAGQTDHGELALGHALYSRYMTTSEATAIATMMAMISN
ncbi:MAG TPA: hypothetical protein VHT04_09500 [Stellaceae bacterium]|jgi:hypothetical protein|nr:hypothetical protein [Stellaceae bacterium]